jgi:hypothetical protein
VRRIALRYSAKDCAALQLHGVGSEEGSGAIDEGVEGDAAFIALGADADADAVGGGFLITEDEDEREFLQAEVADLGLHFAVGGVELYAQADGLETLLDGLGVGEMLLVGDGDEAYLYGREPKGKGAGVVLDEDAEKAFDAAEERAVNHDGLVGHAVFANIFELEAGGEIEVELDGGELPQAA